MLINFKITYIHILFEEEDEEEEKKQSRLFYMYFVYIDRTMRCMAWKLVR